MIECRPSTMKAPQLLHRGAIPTGVEGATHRRSIRGEGRGTLRSEAYEASDGQRSTSLPASAAEVTFPCESRVAFP